MVLNDSSKNKNINKQVTWLIYSKRLVLRMAQMDTRRVSDGHARTFSFRIFVSLVLVIPST